MIQQQPIGIFDSGIGGTSVWKEITALLPYENTIYLADSKHAPYGQRSTDEIIALSKKNTEQLLSFDCKLILVACNTATTNAISVLRSQYDVPFVGIEPAIKPAALSTKTKKIGILATQGTLSSALFSKTSELYAQQTIEIIEVVGKGLVELIEKGKTQSIEMRNLLHTYIAPMIEKKIDHLVLGCTHYPYLTPILQELLPQSVTIIDASPAVALHTLTILQQEGIKNNDTTTPATHQFYTNIQAISILETLLHPTLPGTTIEYLNF